jgi:DNA-binding NtrC family response regulator
VDDSTLRPSVTVDPREGHAAEVPGVVLLFSSGVARAAAMPLVDGALDIGRADTADGKVEDGRVSRRHARVTLEGRRFSVTDLGSQNGTFVDGEPVPANGTRELTRVLRIGDSLLVPSRDVGPLQRRGVRPLDGFVRGPALQALLDEAARAAQLGTTLHIRGESGTGKEGVARAFHRAGTRPSGPFVPVNCAAVPQNLAERLLFGAKKGAYSGAQADADGYVQEADGGTLFLDEVAELDPAVQAKLLRTLEEKEVLPLGASRRSKVDFLLCSATNKDLRALVAQGKLREDLYFRIGRPELALPALRNRPEEIPFLVAAELAGAAPSLAPHVSLVEQCLLRAWPGNVRELNAEVRAAAQAALAEGASRVHARHLAPTAGAVFAGGGGSDERSAAAATAESARKQMPQNVDDEWRRRIEEALRANGGNVAASARALGLHRTQLRRLLERHGLNAAPDAADAPDEE